MISPETLWPGMVVPAALAQLQDTVVMVRAGSGGVAYWADLLADVATILIALALIGVALAVIVAAWKLRRAYGRLVPALDRFRVDVNPLVKRATGVADDVHHISSSLRQDVEMLTRTVASANQRVNRMAATAEQRVNELNALLQVIQEEAEELFIDTASTVRGVREGQEALRRFREGDPAGPARYDDEPDGPEELEIRVRRG